MLKDNQAIKIKVRERFYMSENNLKNLMEEVEQEIQRTQEVMEKLMNLENVSENDQESIQKLKVRLEQLLREYEALKD